MAPYQLVMSVPVFSLAKSHDVMILGTYFFIANFSCRYSPGEVQDIIIICICFSNYSELTRDNLLWTSCPRVKHKGGSDGYSGN